MANHRTLIVMILGLPSLLATASGLHPESDGTNDGVRSERRQAPDAEASRNYADELRTCLHLAAKEPRDPTEENQFQNYLDDLLGEQSNRPIEFETEVITILRDDFALLANDVGEVAWPVYRRAAAKLAIHSWKRIKMSLDENFDINDKPSLNLAPPIETGMPSGVSPDAIKDRALREKYQKAIADNSKKAESHNQQLQLRTLEREFSQGAERYLVDMYARPPFATDELAQLLEAYALDKDTAGKVLASVTDKVSGK